jgi:Ca-activated chloride channel family protein
VVSRLRGDRVGLIAFAGDAFLQCPLTVDYHGFAMSVDALSIDTVPLGGTSFAAAADAVMKGFEGSDPSYRVCLWVTDGENHEGSVSEIAKRLTDANIKVYAVGMGSLGGELIPIEGTDGSRAYVKDEKGEAVKTTLDEQPLKDLALATGGAYVRASGAESGIELMYEKKIAQLEGRSFESKKVKQMEERFQIFVVAALLLLMGSVLLRRVGRAKMHTVMMLCAALLLSGFAYAADRREEKTRVEEALLKAEDAVRKRPADPRAQYNLGCARYAKGDFDQALDAFQRALLTDKRGDEADALYNIANTKFRMAEKKAAGDIGEAVNQMKDALAYYRKAVDKRPGDTAAKENHEFAAVRLKKLLQEQKKQQEEQKQEQQQSKTCPNPQKKDGGNAQQDQQEQQPKAQQGRQEKQEQQKDDKQENAQQKEQSSSAQQQKQDAAARQENVRAAQSQGTAGEKEDEQPQMQQAQVAQQQKAEKDEKDAAAALERFVMQEGDAMLDDRQRDGVREARPQKDW